METALGHGCVAVTRVSRAGRVGILLEQTCEPHDINSTDMPDARCKDGGEFLPTEKDVVIWLDNLEGARVLQDQVNMLCLELNGYNVVKP